MYKSDAWKVLGGEVDFADVKDTFGISKCCDETGLQAKLSAIKQKSDAGDSERVLGIQMKP